jgi:hypothetical protein
LGCAANPHTHIKRRTQQNPAAQRSASGCGKAHNQPANHPKARRQNAAASKLRWKKLKKEGVSATTNIEKQLLLNGLMDTYMANICLTRNLEINKNNKHPKKP